MRISKKFPRFFVQVSLIVSINIPCVQGMETDLLTGHLSDDEEVSCVTKMLQRLYIVQKPATHISKRNQLFAQHLVEYLDAKNIIDGNDVSKKDELRQKFFKIVYALRYGKYSGMIDETQKIVVELCKKSLNDLIKRYENNQDEEAALQKILSFNEINIRTLNTMTLACENAYKKLECIDEEDYIKVLDRITEKCKFGDSMAKALFIEALKTCDTDFAGSEIDYINSLSMTDLKELFGNMCGHPTSDMEKMFMALSGSEELTVCIVAYKTFVLLLIAVVAFTFTFIIPANILSRQEYSPHDNGITFGTSGGMSVATCIAIMGWNSWVYCRTKKI